MVVVYGEHGSPFGLVETTVVIVSVSKERVAVSNGTGVTIVVVYGEHGSPFGLVETTVVCVLNVAGHTVVKTVVTALHETCSPQYVITLVTVPVIVVNSLVTVSYELIALVDLFSSQVVIVSVFSARAVLITVVTKQLLFLSQIVVTLVLGEVSTIVLLTFEEIDV